MTFSIATPLALFLLVVSCGQSSTNDNNDSQKPSIKYTQTTAKRGNIDIKQVLNIDASTMQQGKKLVIIWLITKMNYWLQREFIFGWNKFLNLNIFF